MLLFRPAGFGFRRDLLERFLKQRLLFRSGAAADSAGVHQRDENGENGEREAGEPEDRETERAQPVLQDRLAENKHADGDRKKCGAEPASAALCLVTHVAKIARKPRKTDI